MKSLKNFSVFLLFILLITLAGCNSFSGIKRNFLDAGFTYDDDNKEQIQELLKEFEENDVVVTPHIFKKSYNIAIILEFKSTTEMNEQIKESETLKGFLKDLQKSDFVKGNCILIPIGINPNEMIDIFQGNNK